MPATKIPKVITVKSVPKKLSPAQGKRWLAKAAKAVEGPINDLKDDMLVELHNVALNTTPGLKARFDDGYKKTLAYWSKDIKQAFRTYIRIRDKIQQAVENYENDR